ncbi:uncharacterized protein LOC144107653 [Amblyomma americanum]
MADAADEDPIKVITSNPTLRQHYLGSPRRQRPRQRGAPDDRPPNAGPFESSVIDDDKEECVAMAVWIAFALFATAVSVVVAGGLRPEGEPRVSGGDTGAQLHRRHTPVETAAQMERKAPESAPDGTARMEQESNASATGTSARPSPNAVSSARTDTKTLPNATRRQNQSAARPGKAADEETKPPEAPLLLP